MEVLHLGFLQLIDQEELFSYHWKCEAARIFQLGFADDVILFSRADMESLRIFKAGLDRFAEWSGLRLNVQKSNLIISRSAQALREEMLVLLGFQEGVLPMRYLGLPLISSRLTIADCRLLLLKIDKRIAGWEDATGHRSGLNGCTRDAYNTPPYGRLRTMAAHGDGGKSSDYGCFSEPWWTTGLEMGGISSCGRIRGTTLVLFVTLSHEDRGYLD
ncbi:UNVERIFIED_CONTAM: hypothetical protein Sindi_2873000 [Sesamum indicum]